MEKSNELVEMFLPFSVDIMLVMIELLDWRACLHEDIASALKQILSLEEDGREGYEELIESEFFMIGYEKNERNQIEVTTLLNAMNREQFRGVVQAHLMIDGKYYGKSGDDMSAWPIRYQQFLS